MHVLMLKIPSIQLIIRKLGEVLRLSFIIISHISKKNSELQSDM